MELDESIKKMITKDLVQKMITSMGGQSIRDDKNFDFQTAIKQDPREIEAMILKNRKSSISNIDLKTLTVLEQLYRELNFRPVSWATSLAHVSRKQHLIDELIRLLGYRSVMSFCN
ncbi:hypothetical protein [Limosilactobacillus mucosae]|uniref:hypothetical protein n=1 Tax=Limosilactobacillus mucosae TaxID=97478 RepID=UPI0022DFC373|nr:hypothetical protein [Limosilactobacillus mucosae]